MIIARGVEGIRAVWGMLDMIRVGGMRTGMAEAIGAIVVHCGEVATR